MSNNIETNIKNFIRSDNGCACYDSKSNNIINYCCLEKLNNCQCIFFSDLENKRCKYFESAVLPIRPDLESLYNIHYIEKESKQLNKEDIKDIKEQAKWAKKSKVKCERCGEIFPANSNRQKYCEKCKKIVRTEQLRERKKNNNKN